MKDYYVYIMASKKNGTLYTWVTSDLIKRVYEHKNWIPGWFTKKYVVKNLVYFEIYNDIMDAIEREKQIKAWSRKKKIDLINQDNLDWVDLYNEII